MNKAFHFRMGNYHFGVEDFSSQYLYCYKEKCSKTGPKIIEVNNESAFRIIITATRNRPNVILSALKVP